MGLLGQPRDACRARHSLPWTRQPCLGSIERVVKDIETAAAGIRAGRFPAEPAYQACQYCPYRPICPRGEGE